jgi:hypothetical protein
MRFLYMLPLFPHYHHRGYRYLLICLACLLSACANTTSIATRYQVATDTRIHSLLLAARTPEGDYRHAWEGACESALKTHGLTLINSDKATPDWHDPDPQPLVDWAKTNGVDAVLIVDITGLLLAPPQIPGQPDSQIVALRRAPNETPIGIPTWNLFIGKRAQAQPQSPRLHTMEAQLISNTGKMLWDGVLTTHEANDIGAIADSQCAALRKSLTPAYLP